MIRLVVFDWNGTLLSDTNGCLDADNHVIKFFGGNPVDLKKYRATVTIPSIDFYSRHGCKRSSLIRQSKKLGEIFHSFYEARAKKCRSRKGVKKLLEWLHKNKIHSIILSNHTANGIVFQLKRLKLGRFIECILANDKLDTSMRKRNKAEKLEKYIKEKNFKKNQILIIGDSPEESEISKALHIKSALITDGYYSTSRLKNSKPDFIISNLSELNRIISKIK